MCRPVTAVEIDLLNDAIGDVERGESTGLLLKARLSQIAGELSRWQWVLHGDTQEYRKRVVRRLCDKGQWKTARRFALCGRGDQMGREIGGESVRVKSHGCGCRYCPRCSRRAGVRVAKRVTTRLATMPHGEMLHVVLTQKVIRDEPLDRTRKRFGCAWSKVKRLMDSAGMSGGLATYHCVRSRIGGWHWHAHVIVELKEGADAGKFIERVDSKWDDLTREPGESHRPVFARRVCSAGPAMSGLADGGQGEFWRESENAAERALQYCVRDVVQGVERWLTEITTVEATVEFMEGVSEAKMHRTLGTWRKKLPTCEADESGAPGKPGVEKVSAATKVFEAVGTVDSILWQASQGVRTAVDMVHRLASMNSNRSRFARRLQAAVRFEGPAPGT